ncbi:YjbF family lipoprotein [Celeribacter neptunius]|uniref:Group 4 capsule polysaccharide lipoprotein gfcB, YjbF n=1 Tax=Celeribacter neptunius TaxID=588602 RepID=A0A1I3WV33_9RHOB|nr:YjbF family lipoprotein [Celeribacter neptunius]SFK11150.1 Group 4 capsule polysaccharide lipoprotein gfcB, YjbF [Celeribacter neptunius]
MRSFLSTLLAASVLILAGCGNDATGQRSKATLQELSGLAKTVVGKKAAPSAPADPNVMIANTLKTFEGEPLMFALREKTGAYGIASIYGQNGPVTTWATHDLTSFSLKQGMLVATRGFGNDLMSVEDGGAVRMITARRAGSVQKTYRFLDGQDRTNRLILNCEIVPGELQPVQTGEISTSAQLVRETCRMGTFKFTNTYWVDGSSRVVQSVQWAGSKNGVLIFRRLRW